MDEQYYFITLKIKGKQKQIAPVIDSLRENILPMDLSTFIMKENDHSENCIISEDDNEAMYSLVTRTIKPIFKFFAEVVSEGAVVYLVSLTKEKYLQTQAFNGKDEYNEDLFVPDKDEEEMLIYSNNLRMRIMEKIISDYYSHNIATTFQQYMLLENYRKDLKN